jgi:predicted chitinase
VTKIHKGLSVLQALKNAAEAPVKPVEHAVEKAAEKVGKWVGVGPQKPPPASTAQVEGPTKVDAAESFSQTGLSTKQLRAVMPSLSEDKAAAMLPHLNRAMKEFGIDTPARASAFLAQVAHESGELKYFEELASGHAYEGRRDLGNTQPGDGERYKGRGPIQLTGRANYERASKALGVDLVNHPELDARPDIGFRIAGWFWQTKGLNQLADKGEFNEITRRVNGGFNGAASRNGYYAKAQAALGGGMAGGPLSTGETPIPTVASGPHSYGIHRGTSYESSGAEAQRMVQSYAQRGGFSELELYTLLLMAMERFSDADASADPDFAAFAQAAGSDWKPGMPVPEDLKTEFLADKLTTLAKTDPAGLRGALDSLKAPPASAP